MLGYSGPNCTIPCPYPLYGERCQGDCSSDRCDVSTGCTTLTTGSLLYSYNILKKITMWSLNFINKIKYVYREECYQINWQSGLCSCLSISL